MRRIEKQLHSAKHHSRDPYPAGREERKKLEPHGAVQRLREVQAEKQNLSARKNLVAGN